MRTRLPLRALTSKPEDDARLWVAHFGSHLSALAGDNFGDSLGSSPTNSPSYP